MSVTLALGTVQFGMAYGVANRSGRPEPHQVAQILTLARGAGIDMLDTAIAYGEAEAVLGRIGIAGWRVVTKLPPVQEDVADVAGWMEAQVTGSLTRLGLVRLHGLLLHAPNQMAGARGAEIGRALQRMAAAGFAERVGVSVQHPDADLPAVLRHMAPGIVQSPFNILDRALVTQGWAARLGAMGCEVHARSAFLQGLLLLPAAERPGWAAEHGGFWSAWDGWLARQGLSAAEACLRFVRSAAGIDVAVVGVDSAAQLGALLALGAGGLPDVPDWAELSDRRLITPSLWPRA